MSNYKVVTAPVVFPETQETKGGGCKVLDTYKNLEWLLSLFSAEIRYNLMTRCREVTIPNQYIFRGDMENSSLSQVEYLATINHMPTKQIDRHLDKIAQENIYHPIVECIQQNPWDMVPRVEQFINTLKFARNPETAAKIVRTWMTQAIAAAHSEDGFINQGVLVLQSPQGDGKTTWVKNLDPINCRAVKESIFLDPSNKDSVKTAATYWIVELAELECIFKKSDIGRLKAFITTQYDDIRLPYARRNTQFERRTAYVATVNGNHFLVDDTGNRRWWVVQVESIQEKHDLNMQQVWAEIYHYWKLGAPTDLDKETKVLLNADNRQHERVDPIKEKILTAYDWTSTSTRWMTTTQVMEEIGYDKPNRADASHAGKILSELVGKDGTGSKSGYTRYSVPFLLTKRQF